MNIKGEETAIPPIIIFLTLQSVRHSLNPYLAGFFCVSPRAGFTKSRLPCVHDTVTSILQAC